MGLEAVKEAENSAQIIDLESYRSTRRSRRTGAGTAGTTKAGPAAGSLALPVFWFFPTWVWMPVPAAPDVRWDSL